MTHYRKRILIVEDNRIDVRLLKDILEEHGHETVQTGDGLEAINLALAYRPDLILMDLRLPQLSGLEVTRRLRSDDRSRQIPIIAVRLLQRIGTSTRPSTADVTPSSQNRSRSWGC